MSTNGTRSVTLGFTGDVPLPTMVEPAVANPNSPAKIDYVSLTTGDNTFPIPTAGTTKSVTILKPNGNTTALLFKRVTGDQGHELDPVDPDSFSVGSGCTQIVIHAAGPVTGVRIVWE